MRTTLLILLLAVTGMGQSGLRSPAFVSQLQRPSASSLLINEDFEGTGTPSPWVASAGTPNFDNTSAPLAGAQDLKMGDAADCDVNVPFTASGEVWLEFKFKMASVPGSPNALLYVADTGFSGAMWLAINASGQLSVVDGGGASTDTTDAMAATTPYWIFLHVSKGTGANAVYDVEFSTTSTRTGSGNKFKAKTNGNFAVNAEQGLFRRTHTSWGAGITFQVDNVKISNTGWPP